jgi:acetyl-CoA C-acetyltransferase
MESMSSAPYYVDGARRGLVFGDAVMRDAVVSDGLTDAFPGAAIGAATDGHAEDASISREAQDAVALRSQGAAVATRDGRLADEIIAVAVPQRRGGDLVIRDDQGIRDDTSTVGLGALKPAFGPAGTITAGNASEISDGAAALVVMSRRAAERLGREPLAEIVSFGRAAGPGTSLLTQTSRAIADALGRSRLRMADLDVIEVNEAFAAVVLASAGDPSVPVEVLNPNGGAIAPGHPIGMCGARLPLTLALELRRRGGGTGAAALCGGGGLGGVVILRAIR